MKAGGVRQVIFVVSATLLSAGMALYGDEEIVEPGMDRDLAIEVLGEPNGRVAGADYEVLIYLRGTLRVSGGEIVEVDLVSEEAARQQRAERRERREAVRVKREAERRARIEEGRSIREERIRTAEFSEKNPGEQLAVLEAFRARYPEVDIAFEYQTARQLAKEERRREERERARERERWRRELLLEERKAKAARPVHRVTVPFRTTVYRVHRPCDRRIVIRSGKSRNAVKPNATTVRTVIRR